MSIDDVEDLLAEADGMPFGPARIGKTEEAVRAADALGDEDLAFDARLDLIEAAFFGGGPEKGFVAFTWCLAKVDEDPERFPETDLLWKYKWVVEHLHAYPQFTRSQIEAAIEDMETRYTRNGLSLRPAWAARMHAAMELDGDFDKARELYRKWQWTQRDRYADCAACEDHSIVDLHVRMGQLDRAFDAARGLLEGRRRCAEVPHKTYAVLLEPARQLGNLEEAERLHRVGLPMVDSNPDFVRDLAYHLDHRVLSGHADAALLVPGLLDWAVATHDLDSKLWSYASLRLHLARNGGEDLSVPKPLRKSLGETTSSAALRDHLDAEIRALARRFDDRNGNTVVSQRLEAHAALGV